MEQLPAIAVIFAALISSLTLPLAGNGSSCVITTVVSHRVSVARMLTHHLNEKS